MTNGKTPPAPIVTTAAGITFARASRIVWRQGPDRILLRRLGGDGIDLLGAAAMVWIALDVPRNLDDLTGELSEFIADTSTVAETVSEMVALGVLIGKRE